MSTLVIERVNGLPKPYYNLLVKLERVINEMQSVAIAALNDTQDTVTNDSVVEIISFIESLSHAAKDIEDTNIEDSSDHIYAIYAILEVIHLARNLKFMTESGYITNKTRVNEILSNLTDIVKESVVEFPIKISTIEHNITMG